MKTGAILTRLSMHLGRRTTEAEVEEELRFHVELLTRDFMRQGMSRQEAVVATVKRFGDVGSVKRECVVIRHRSRRLMCALKSFLILILLAGVLVRVLSADFYVGKVGEMLIAVAALTRLLLYARNLRPSKFPPEELHIFAGDGY